MIAALVPWELGKEEPAGIERTTISRHVSTTSAPMRRIETILHADETNLRFAPLSRVPMATPTIPPLCNLLGQSPTFWLTDAYIMQWLSPAILDGFGSSEMQDPLNQPNSILYRDIRDVQHVHEQRQTHC